MMDRDKRIDTQTTLTKPISPDRVERPGTTSSPSDVRDKSVTPDRKARTVKEMVDQRQRARTKIPEATDAGKSQQEAKERPAVRTPRTVKNSPRSSEKFQKPKMIEQTKPKSTPATPKKNYSTPKKSSERSSNSVSRPANSGDTKVSKPSTKSYTPQSSSSSRSTTRSTPTRSSNGKSSSSSSKSSGSSKTKK
jgi:hypothetical protein